MQGVPKEGNEAEQAKEERGGSLNRQIGPWPLGLDASIRPAFFERRLQTPPLHEIEDNFLSGLAWIGRKQRFGRASAVRITRQYPADG
jgi:hypothetical protein